jgi:hypothetical protein
MIKERLNREAVVTTLWWLFVLLLVNHFFGFEAAVIVALAQIIAFLRFT